MVQLLRIITLLCLWLLWVGMPAHAADTLSMERVQVSFTGRYLQGNKLLEPHSFSPVEGLVPQSTGWQRTWREQEWYVAVTAAPLACEIIRLDLGLYLGAAQGQFTARNEGAGFSETWHTDSTMLWGGAARLELRLSPDSGPFMELGYDFFYAAADERRERIESIAPQVAQPDERDARFWWTRHEGTLFAGWRFATSWGVITPVGGARWRYFKLKKRLIHHLPLPAPGAPGYAIRQRLNAVPSRFEYTFSSRLVPVIGLRWDISSRLSLDVSAILSRDQDIGLSLSLSL